MSWFGDTPEERDAFWAGVINAGLNVCLACLVCWVLFMIYTLVMR